MSRDQTDSLSGDQAHAASGSAGTVTGLTASPVRAFLGLGGNVGDVAAQFGNAIALLAAAPAVQIAGASSLWRTPPWGDEDQPPFLNACLEVVTTLTPLALLDLCLGIERRLGRDREAPGARRWGPRPIDIDVLDYAGVTLDAPRLSLPHPRLGERAFALAPLVELAPDLPVLAKRADGAVVRMKAREALASLPADGLERLEGWLPAQARGSRP